MFFSSVLAAYNAFLNIFPTGNITNEIALIYLKSKKSSDWIPSTDVSAHQTANPTQIFSEEITSLQTVQGTDLNVLKR